ncbi:MAG: DUF58 domain-containing protein [Planctomycetota bacterium]|nr:MAG: DUF58 domain-containing protein [Planctomycetota bacterium]
MLRASDPRLLARLARLELRARTAVEGLAGGRHRSPLRGASSTFAAHREYVPGDDLRHLDWRVMARSDRSVVREFEEETDLTAYVVLDASASMAFGSLEWSKLAYATWIAAAVTRLLVIQNDYAGLAVCAGSALAQWLAPHGGERHWQHLVGVLENLQASGTGDAAEAWEAAGARMERRGLVLWISDCLVDPERAARAGARLRHAGHDLMVLRILDPAEIEFPYGRTTRFDALEGLDRLLLEPRAVRQAYLEEFEQHDQALRRGLRGLQADYRLLRTDEALETTLVEFLNRRQARLRRAGR